MVWHSIDHSPGFAALAAALDRHIGPAAGATMRAPFALNDEDALRDLLARSADVAVHRQAGTIRFNSTQEFVLAQGAGSPWPPPSPPPTPPTARASPPPNPALVSRTSNELAP